MIFWEKGNIQLLTNVSPKTSGKRQMKTRILISLVAFALGCKLFQGNNVQTPDETAGAVVTFVHGSVLILEKGKEIKPKIGHLVRIGDQIQTKLGSIDLQTYRGEVIRIKDNSQITFKSLPGDKNPSNALDVAFGNLIVKSTKLKSNQSITISSPTMVAGVRGTSFSFELDKGSVPKIKVFEGSVAVAFRTPKEIIESNELINKEAMDRLVKTLEKHEVILEPGEALDVDPKINEMVFLINTKIAENNLTEKQLEGFKIGEEELKKKEFQSSPQEKAELETLVQIEEDSIQKALTPDEAVANANSGLSGEIESKHEEKRKEAFAKITKEAETKNLDDEAEIHNHYSILETIHKSNGETLSGAVIAQLGDIFIVHSTKGVFELNVEDIEYVEYKNFKIKTKPKTK